jgi:hypothetical protein
MERAAKKTDRRVELDVLTAISHGGSLARGSLLWKAMAHLNISAGLAGRLVVDDKFNPDILSGCSEA